MLDALLEIVTDWLETRGYEPIIDYDDDIIWYEDDNEDLVKFCIIDEDCLQRKIEDYNMDEIDIIE